MKDLTIGLLLGFVVGVTCYYLGDGALNRNARADAVANQKNQQAQLEVLKSLCPDVLKNAQAQKGQ